jgi:hypothetical protein
LALAALAACESPVAYRPEVQQFNKATAEASAYMEAERKSLGDLRADLRRDALSERQPFVQITEGCFAAIQKFNQLALAADPAPLEREVVEACGLALPDDSEIEGLFDPGTPVNNAAAFAEAVSTYAAALDEVATSADQAGFENAVTGLGDAAISLATSATAAAEVEPPSIEALSPIAAFVGKASYYYLENRRAEALKDAAASAQPWIETGSQGVVRVLYAAHFEEINVAKDELLRQLDDVNEASESSYVRESDEAIAKLATLRQLLGDDPGAPFRKLPVAHAELIKAFDDRERHLSGAIAAAKDLFESARAARAAIVNE